VYRVLTCLTIIFLSRDITYESNKLGFTIFGGLLNLLCNLQVCSINKTKKTRGKMLGPPGFGAPTGGPRRSDPAGRSQGWPQALTRHGGAPECAHDAARARGRDVTTGDKGGSAKGANRRGAARAGGSWRGKEAHP
jgi:hypothetical protein